MIALGEVFLMGSSEEIHNSKGLIAIFLCIHRHTYHKWYSFHDGSAADLGRGWVFEDLHILRWVLTHSQRLGRVRRWGWSKTIRFCDGY